MDIWQRIDTLLGYTRPFLARRTDLPQIADRRSGLRLARCSCSPACRRVRCGRTTTAVDAAWQGSRRQRFSELDQITSSNVGKLRSVSNFSTGVLSGHEGQPLVVNDTMYVVTPYPNVLYAFDLTKEDYPLRFKYRPDVNPAAVGHRLLRLGESRRRAMPKERSSTTCWMGAQSRSTRRPARKCGKLQWPISRAARRSPWRLWSWAIAYSSVPRAGSTESAAGSRRSTWRPGSSFGGAQFGPGQRRAGEARHFQTIL